MAGGLIAKARRLELARGVGRRSLARARPVGLVWSGVEVEVDPMSLGSDDDLVVSDFIVYAARWPAGLAEADPPAGATAAG